MERPTLAQRHAHDAPLCGFGGLADRLGHLPRLSVAESDPPLLVANDDERGKAEPATALDDFRDAVDVDEAVDELAVTLIVLVIAATAAFFTGHFFFPSLMSQRTPDDAAARFRCH